MAKQKQSKTFNVTFQKVLFYQIHSGEEILYTYRLIDNKIRENDEVTLVFYARKKRPNAVNKLALKLYLFIVKRASQ